MMTKRTALKQASPEPKRRQGSVSSNASRATQRRRRDSLDLDNPEGEYVPSNYKKPKRDGDDTADIAKSHERSIRPATRNQSKKLTGTAARKAIANLARQGGGKDQPDADEYVAGRMHPEDIKRGHIVSIYWGEENNTNVIQRKKTAKQSEGFEMLKTKKEGIEVHLKFRKFLIIGVFKKHFVALPIYSHKKGELNEFTQHFAQITDRALKQRFMTNTPTLRGRPTETNPAGTWLFSERIMKTKWGLMGEHCILDMARPVSFHYNVSAQLCSKLSPDSDIQVAWQWYSEAMKEGFAKNAAVVPDRGDEEILYR